MGEKRPPGEKNVTPPPGAVLDVVIEDVAFGGDGVGRVGGRVVFVPFTAPGDEVRVTVGEIKKRYARGVVREVVKASPLRVPPRCRHFTRCGGCCYQHLPYELQTRLKEGQVREIFRRIGRFAAPSVTPVVPSPRPYHYRGKGEFVVTQGRGGKATVGLIRRGSHETVEIERCEIVHDSINEALAALTRRAAAGEDRRRRLTLWSVPEGAPPPPVPKDRVWRTCGGRTFLVPQRGFFQNNLYLVEDLVAVVGDLCGLKGEETVIDAYGGSGLFSLFLAPSALRVIGIEADPEACSCARLNVERAGLRNVEWITGDAGEVLGFLARRLGGEKVCLVLDPPRGGLDPRAFSSVCALEPARIVYVSCHPPTQARDCRLLADGGWRLEEVVPLDMFPQTAHVEAVALLTREGVP